VTDRNTPPGPGVDASGQAVVDPTANVIALNDAANKRQDDLRELTTAHMREIGDLRERYHESMRLSESKHLREMADLRADFYDELRDAESDRIDAIRAVDVGAVNRAAEVAATQASVLAAQLAATAEAGRTQVAAAAQAQTVTIGAALVPIQEAIADLRRVQYEQVGQKAQVIEGRSGGANVALWVFGAIAALGVLGTLFMGAVSLGVAIYFGTR